MANNTTTQASYIQEDPQADENIPPKSPNPTDSSEFENAALNKMERFPSGGNDVNVFDTHAFSTPAPKNKSSEGQVASRLSGFPSALTPVLRYLNIGNKSPSLEPFKHRKPPNPSVPSSFPAANCQKSAGQSRRRTSDEDFSMINDECLPEMTFCDLSGTQLTANDSFLPDSLWASPHPYGKQTHLQTGTGDQSSLSELPPLSTDHQVRVDHDFETALSSHGLIDNYLQDITLLELSQDLELSPADQMSSVDFTPVLSPAGRLKASKAASDRSDQILTELVKSDTITDGELSVTGVNSAQCAIKASLDVTQDVTMGRTLENSGSSDASARAINVTHDLTSSCNVSSSGINGSVPEFYSEPREKPGSADAEMEVLQTSGETKVSRDGSQESPESDTGGREVEMSENSDARAINVTHDLNSSSRISSSGINGSIPEFHSEPAMEVLQTSGETKVSRDGSPQSPESQTGGQEVEKYHNPDGDSLCTKAINITREINHEATLSATLSSWTTDRSIPGLEPEPKDKPLSVDTETAELPSSCGTKSTSKESRQSPTSDVSNGKFTVERASTASDDNAAPPVSCLNETLDLPTADGGESGEQQSSVSVKAEASCAKSLQKPKIQICCALGETPASLGQRIDTSDSKPRSEQNATITLSEMSSSVTQQSCLGNASAPKALNLTTTLKEECSENHASKLQRNEPGAKTDGSPSRTSEGHLALEPAAASDGSRDGSQSGLQVAEDAFDLSNQESLDSITSKSHTFNLDETLDLRTEISSTSTPMPNGKMFTFESKREVGQVLAPQRKLYGNPPDKPSQKTPSSIVCDRQTFLPPSAPKHLLPPSKPAAPLMTGLPVKRHRPEGDSGKSTASEEQRGKASLSSSYNLRSLASKLPVSGLQRPQRSGIPVGFPKAAPAPRTAASSTTEKLGGSAGLLKAANPVTKAGKKHPLTKGEPLPLSKKKKMDKLVQSSNTDAPASGCDSANGVKALKLRPINQRPAPDKASKPGAAVPASTAKTVTACDASSRGSSLKPPVTNQRAPLTGPQSHIAGCARCGELERENQLQSQEIQKLKEELLKWKTRLTF